MTDYNKLVRIKQTWPWWGWLLTGLNILALILSAIMSWHYLAGGSIAGCGGGSPCEQVLGSRWSVIAGILPVSGLAVGIYLAMFVCSLYIGPAAEMSIRRLAWSVLLIMSGSITGSALWFIILQKWVIGAFCAYCMAAHLTGLLLSFLIIRKVTIKSEVEPAERLIRPAAVTGLVIGGLALAGIMAVSQISLTPRAIYEDGESNEVESLIDYSSAPMIGSPDAPYIVTLLFDYQCSHCQKLHFMLEEVIRHYNDKLSFVLCPSPLSNQCNPYITRDSDTPNNSCDLVRISLAVWLADHEAFHAMENWMFTYESGSYWLPRNPEAAREKAIGLIGREKFETAFNDPWIDNYLQISTRIYGRTIQNGMGGIPKMIFGQRWVIPQPYNANDLIKILQESLAVPGP